MWVKINVNSTSIIFEKWKIKNLRVDCNFISHLSIPFDLNSEFYQLDDGHWSNVRNKQFMLHFRNFRHFLLVLANQ